MTAVFGFVVLFVVAVWFVAGKRNSYNSPSVTYGGMPCQSSGGACGNGVTDLSSLSDSERAGVKREMSRAGVYSEDFEDRARRERAEESEEWEKSHVRETARLDWAIQESLLRNDPLRTINFTRDDYEKVFGEEYVPYADAKPDRMEVSARQSLPGIRCDDWPGGPNDFYRSLFNGGNDDDD